MRSISLSRRDLLRGFGATALLAPFATLMDPEKALAAPAKRALFVYVPDGCIPRFWHPTGGESDFVLPKMSAPLEPIRQHLIFLDGLAMYDGAPTHEGGIAKVLTGLTTQEKSLDVFLSENIAGSTPHKLIQLGVGSNYMRGEPGTFTYLGGGVAMLPDDNPLSVFSRVFGSVSGNEGGDDIEKRRKKSVLDAARSELTALKNRLGTTEREKLDVHLESLRELEARITGQGLMACDIAGFNSEGFTVVEDGAWPPAYHREEHFATITNLQIDLAVLALSCGASNVVSLQFSHQVSPTRVPDAGMAHHDSSHYGEDTSAAAEEFVKSRGWFMKQFVSLIQKLEATPDGDGSLLSNTLVFMFTDVGDANTHDHKRMPFVLAGGAGRKLKTGRALTYGTSDRNEAHTKLLVTIAHALDVPIDRFNHVPVGSSEGPLDGIL